ncbi:MAG: hypothetical protein V8Q43_02395 [Christensenellaceae bacterium]
MFTVQEEVGARGAEAAVYRVQPDLALILEGTTANDMPEAESHQQVTEVGAGPAISLMDNGTIVNPQLFRAMKQMAEQRNIPHQVRQGTRGGTDAGVIHKALSGAARDRDFGALSLHPSGRFQRRVDGAILKIRSNWQMRFCRRASMKR